jgi:hypothetical protein
MRKLLLIGACFAAALMFSYSPPPARSWLPSLGISHAAAQYGHYRRVARRGYRRAVRYGAYAAGASAGYYGYPYGYGYGGYGYGGYRGVAFPGHYRRVARRVYRRGYY